MSDADRIKLSRSNIIAALGARGKSSFEASVELGKNCTYIDDYIKGRKASVSILFAQSLADYLKIHRSYIEGSRKLPDEIDNAIPARGYQASISNLQKSIDRIDEEIKAAEKGSFRLTGRAVDAEGLAELKAHRERLNNTALRLNNIDELIADYNISSHPSAERGWAVSFVFASKVLNSDSRNLIVIAIEDNSMRSMGGEGLPFGERLIVDISKKDFRRGGPFAISHEGTVVIRLIEMETGSDEETFVGKPLNPHFPVIDLGPTPIERVVGRVVGQIRPL